MNPVMIKVPGKSIRKAFTQNHTSDTQQSYTCLHYVTGWPNTTLYADSRGSISHLGHGFIVLY